MVFRCIYAVYDSFTTVRGDVIIPRHLHWMSRRQTVYDSHYCTVKEEIVDNLDEAPVTKEATVKKETLEKVSLMSLL